MDTRVERAAVLAVERSILEHTDLVTAQPVADFGIDLLAFHPEPFGAIPVQIKGAQSGLTVWGRYSHSPVVMAYVLDPLGAAPTVCIMSGREAWDLPFEYVRRGGKAGDHDVGNLSYRWQSVTRLLGTMLGERVASRERWAALFEEVRPK